MSAAAREGRASASRTDARAGRIDVAHMGAGGSARKATMPSDPTRPRDGEASDQARFDQLHRELLACRDCQARFGFEPHPVVRGNARAKIMQISQAPSGRVHETLLPFDDASGRKLKGEWYRIPDAVFYDPDNFYLTSCGHCYPGRSPGGGDRLPPAACAEKWLRREAEAVDCRLYICIGSRAARFFFPGEDFAALVFRENAINGKPALVLPHPSPLNIKWFQDHPRFLAERVPEIGALVRRTLGLE